MAKIPAKWSDRRLWLMLAFGFASGLPWPLSGLTLRQWMTEGHIALVIIGATGSLGLSYSLKFLWSPLLDRVRPGPFARFGRRRGWLLLIQPALLVAMIALSRSDPVHAVGITLAIGGLIAFLSASQDVVIDAWRIESFPAETQAFALAAYIWGYRMALLVGGAGAIALASPLGWHGALLVIASAGLVGIAATLLAPEPLAVVLPAATTWLRGIKAAFAEPLGEFLRRPGAIAVIAYVILFKLGESMAAVMLFPLYKSLGFTRQTVALAQGPVALAATIGGYLVGGWIVRRVGLGRALITTGFGQMAVMTMYVALALSAGSHPMLIGTSITESFVEGIADAAFLTFLSSLCAPAFTATQYALLSSAASLPLRTLGGFAGKLAGATGFPVFYGLTAAASLPAMLIMVMILIRWPATVRQGRGSAPNPARDQVPGPIYEGSEGGPARTVTTD